MNPLSNIYMIDRSNPDYIKVKSADNEYSLQQRHETFEVEDCFITRFEQENGQYIQYTDINGISSETILTPKDFDELKEDIALDTNYCVLAIKKNDSPEDTFYAYICLDNQTEE